MVPFDIQLPARTVFGRGRATEALTAAAKRFFRPLIVHGSSAARADWVISLWPDAPTFSCGREPDLPMLEDALLRARTSEIDAVVAIGGGAVLDLGKAVAGLARATSPVLTYLEVVGEGRALDAEPLPFIAIPTTSGTGAEATRNAVIGIPQHHRKVSVRDPRMIAALAIVDPALTDGCPRQVTLASGLDAITQLIEPYLSLLGNNFTDAIVREALEPALDAICRLSKGEDWEARDVMAFASHMSGIALSHAGLGPVHGLAGVIGGMTEAAHGEVCATLLASTLIVNHRVCLANRVPTNRFDEIEALFRRQFRDMPGDDGFSQLAAWVKRMGIRPLSDLGVKDTDFAVIAEMARTSSSMKANPVFLSSDALGEILRLAQ